MNARRTPFVVFVLVFLICLSSVGALAASHSNVSLPVTFEENRGQVPQPYRFLSRHNDVEAMFRYDSVDLLLPGDPDDNQHLRLRLVGSNENAQISPAGTTEGQSNYLLGPDPSLWIRGVPNYSRLKYAAIYQGVDLVFYGNGNELEHDFQLTAGADPSQIALQFDGAESVNLSKAGDLHIHLKKGTLVLDKPIAYQTGKFGRRSVPAAYAIGRDGTIRFSIGRYDIGHRSFSQLCNLSR